MDKADQSGIHLQDSNSLTITDSQPMPLNATVFKCYQQISQQSCQLISKHAIKPNTRNWIQINDFVPQLQFNPQAYIITSSEQAITCTI